MTDGTGLPDPEEWKTWPDEKKAALLRQLKYSWKLWARPAQLPPEGDWSIWMYLAGRASGKSRALAEYCKTYALEHPGARIGIICPTYGVVRDVALEGQSGLLGVMPPDEIAKNGHNRSLSQLTLKNGSRFFGYSGADPEKLRGPQHNLLWCEEMGAWQYSQAAWDMAQFGLRLGEHPRTVISTTPRPIPVLKDLVAQDGNGTVVITRASTFANAANLPDVQIEFLKRKYGGTHLGRQELLGLLIDDAQGALWKRDQIEMDRVKSKDDIPPMTRVVVGVDPAMTSGPEADETGIIVVGLGVDGHGYVFADRSLRGSPDAWANAVNRARNDFQADRVVAERNQGGELVEHTIHTVDPLIPYKAVWAAKGKLSRAEPVSALYEQHRMHHVGSLPELEDEMFSWLPNDPKIPSPNRIDALVWAVTELMLGGGGPSQIVFADFDTVGRIPRL